MSSDNGGIIGVVNDPTSTTASGVWQQEEQYEAKVNDTWPQRPLFTTKSLRFNSGSSDYLTRTPSSASNKDLWSLSFWIKRSNLGSYQSIYGVYADSNNQETLAFMDTDQLYWQLYQSGGVVGQLTTNRLFRDTSAWYHIVVAYDSANGTAGNRMRMYINGVEETSFATDTNPSSGQDSQWNSTTAHTIGRINTTNYINGYISELVAVDGQALAPTSFGVTNSDGVWTPIPYSGTFGTNGFNLQFEDASSLGTDSSANGNNFTVNNLTSIDQSTDYPVVNYATINPLTPVDTTVSEGNLKYSDATSNFKGVVGTFGASSGKWYYEVKIVTVGDAHQVGIVDIDQQQGAVAENPGSQSNGYSLSNERDVYNNNGILSGYTDWTGTYGNGDIMGIAMDLDNNKLYFSKGGQWSAGDGTWGSTTFNPSTAPITINSGVTYTFSTSAFNGTGEINFGSPSFAISSGNTDGNGYGNFEYAVPSGYYALNTANLAEFG
jgi:hypothetical protein